MASSAHQTLEICLFFDLAHVDSLVVGSPCVRQDDLPTRGTAPDAPCPMLKHAGSLVTPSHHAHAVIGVSSWAVRTLPSLVSSSSSQRKYQV